MVLDWGMSDAFKNVAYGEESEQVFLGKDLSNQKKYSEETGSAVDKSIRAILEEAYQKAETILTEKREVLDNVANLLIETEQVSGKKVLSLLNGEAEELLEENNKNKTNSNSESETDSHSAQPEEAETTSKSASQSDVAETNVSDGENGNLDSDADAKKTSHIEDDAATNEDNDDDDDNRDRTDK